MALAWYIVHTYSGYEQRVNDLLEERVLTQDLKERVAEIFIPMESVVERRKGKTVTTSRKFFPGYILVRLNYESIQEEDSPEVKKVKLDMNARIWSVVRETPRVTGFVGAGGEPMPISDEEVERLQKQVAQAQGEPAQPRFTFGAGDRVRIADGPFTDFTGVVEAVNEERKTLKIMVTVFGRSTPVEVEFLQAEKA